jgi:hypothetical protein
LGIFCFVWRFESFWLLFLLLVVFIIPPTHALT